MSRDVEGPSTDRGGVVCSKPSKRKGRRVCAHTHRLIGEEKGVTRQKVTLWRNGQKKAC